MLFYTYIYIYIYTYLCISLGPGWGPRPGGTRAGSLAGLAPGRDPGRVGPVPGGIRVLVEGSVSVAVVARTKQNGQVAIAIQ